MPSLRKLHVNSDLLPRGRDLTVFSVPSPDSLIESELDISNMIHRVPNIDILIGKENDIPENPSSPPPRKRQRLDHLSQEEKIMRRKLKNRVAAQSARDRKKARMTELEEQVIELEQQSHVLQIENQELLKKNTELEVQNSELKLRLALSDKQTSEAKGISAEQSSDLAVVEEAESSSSEEGGSLEYAEGTGFATPCSLDDAIRLLANDCETGDILDVLQQYSPDLFRCDDLSAIDLVTEETLCEESPDGEVVGSSSKGLESIKELIQFDHIYHKRSEVDSIVESSQSESITFHSKASIKDTDNLVYASPSDNVQMFIISDGTIKEEPNDDIPAASKSPYDPLPSPASSDAGYDSSFSAMSPSSEIYNSSSPNSSGNDQWDNSFSVLFPSLV